MDTITEGNEKRCCNTCKLKLELLTFNYPPSGGCKHSENDGFCCLGLAAEGVAVHMVGVDPDSGICENYIRRGDGRSD